MNCWTFLNEIECRIETIRAKSGDEEIAHQLEDKLHRDVLKAISKLRQDEFEFAPLFAKKALGTCKLKFSRWYA